ncbi:MAG: copper chaperone PCu(A)C [Confluentimicrobium sp.]|uniref:copper chaperone PCu(A)C n=1 Tax=Actibacterium sp. TaxID=1872125 RepID=UPI00050EA911|nr:copper chaperone PCu(A)C [Actibacterium sp.]KGB80606.1 hypothetical protein JT55_17985 [Rhodovulum sp. NI22]MBC56743.1 copper chaperone PCu(A)C [Actibacterium sp.]|tara:strand:- start:578 stop:1060 length:483 start_codon:yes stop_codon:yes gene_type:complete
MRHLFFATALLAPTFAWAQEDHDHRHHLAELQGFRAVHAWTRATTAAEALVFVELENRGTTTVLVEGAETDIADTVELVGIKLVDGEQSYFPLPPLPVEPGREMHLDPDGLAIRLTGLDRDLIKGSEFEMHLETSLGELEIHVSVQASDARHHSHAGHSH